MPAAARRSMNTVWSGKIDSSSPSMTLRWNSSGSRKQGGPADGTTTLRPDRLDVALGPGELRLDLLVDQGPHQLGRVVVHHRVPDGPGVLQPLDVDRTVRGERGQVVDPAVVHVEQADLAVVDDERRVAAGAVADRRLDVDGDGQTLTELHRPGVPRADEALEAEAAQRALELVGGVAGQQHRRTPVDVLGEEGQVEVVGVEVGDVEVVGPLDRLADPRRAAGRCGGRRTTSRRTRARTRGRRRSRPGRSRSGSRRGRARWRASASGCREISARATRPGREAVTPRRRSADGRVRELLPLAGDVLGPLGAVPVAQLVAGRGVRVPAGRRRDDGCRLGGRCRCGLRRRSG